MINSFPPRFSIAKLAVLVVLFLSSVVICRPIVDFSSAIEDNAIGLNVIDHGLSYPTAARGAHAAQAGEEVRLRECRQQVPGPVLRAVDPRGVHLPPKESCDEIPKQVKKYVYTKQCRKVPRKVCENADNKMDNDPARASRLVDGTCK